MRVAYYIKKNKLKDDPRVLEVVSALESGGAQTCSVLEPADIDADCDMLLSFGGDGTFLSAAQMACRAGVPILGVNMGRMGFLSGARIEELADRILSRDYHIEEREMLDADGFLALNEIVLCRSGSNAVGIEVQVDGTQLPTYWADGLIVSTTSGSTAYNLSVGGPICMPGSRVMVVSPIAPHNLGVRPLVIPDTSEVYMKIRSRCGSASFSYDNRQVEVPDGFSITVRKADMPLKCISVGHTSFIDALRSRLFWGMDVRNTSEQ